MKTKDIQVFTVLSACLPLVLMVLCLSLVSCDGPSDLTSYRVTFNTGEGYGAAPLPQTVAQGKVIELPGQENMRHSTGKVLSGWRTGGATYDPYYHYTVNSDVEFTAQWKATTSSPGGNDDDDDDYDEDDDDEDDDDDDDDDYYDDDDDDEDDDDDDDNN